jgi:oligopeptide/dipeptide ABC transporter ATP-binding protein
MAVTETVQASGGAELLKARDLAKAFPVRGGRHAVAVDDVSFRVPRGATLGVVGESGCGKSTLARLIVGLIQPDHGQVAFEGEDLPASRPKHARRNIQMVFQDPFSALNPKASVGESIALPLRVHGQGRHTAQARVRELLGLVGLHANHASYYPHQLSGGQRQRVNIARALALHPKLVVCDEAVSALDKSIQAQILNLLRDLQLEQHLSYIFISHDLNVVEYMSDEVAVMYLGRIVETGPSELLYRESLHPYTQALLASIPQLDSTTEEPPLLNGEIPSPLDPPSGCRFRTRCPYAAEICAAVAPPLAEVAPRHWVACHLHPAPSARRPSEPDRVGAAIPPSTTHAPAAKGEPHLE